MVKRSTEAIEAELASGRANSEHLERRQDQRPPEDNVFTKHFRLAKPESTEAPTNNVFSTYFPQPQLENGSAHEDTVFDVYFGKEEPTPEANTPTSAIAPGIDPSDAKDARPDRTKELIEKFGSKQSEMESAKAKPERQR